MVSSKEMHDNMEKHLLMPEHVKNATYSRKIYRRFKKERGMSINESMAKQDNSIMITALPKMTKPLIPLINMANRLNYLNPNTTNNHEQYYSVAGCW
jgi:hypothetical protein